MRLAVRNTLAFLLLYGAVLAGVAVWGRMQLREVAAELLNQTATMIGTEVGRIVSAQPEVLLGDRAAQQRLEELVHRIAERSPYVKSLTVVGERGYVLVSDIHPPGHQLALPSLIFEDQPGVQTSEVVLVEGDYHVLVPIRDGERLRGYLRLGVRDRSIAHLFSGARRQLLIAGVAGFVAIAAAGLFFHLQLSRRTSVLAQVLEQAAEGRNRPTAVADEFSRPVEVAVRLGRELTSARAERFQAYRRMGALMRATHVGVLQVDAERRLVFANPIARELFDTPAPGELESRWEAIVDVLAEPLEQIGEQPGAQADVEIPAQPEPLRLRLEIYPLEDEQGGEVLVLVKNRGMVEALRDELGLAIQMRALTRYYTAFVHDLKAPLNAMVMNLELLEMAVAKPGTEEKRARYLRVLREEIARLNRMLQTLLSHVRQPGDTPQRIDLRELVEELIRLLQPQAGRQRVTLRSTLPENGVPVYATPDRLKQAFLNIAINALEVMPDGGDLSVDLDCRDGEAVLRFRDSGPGIPKDVLRHIYEMHFTTKSGGTGLGLYLARTVVEDCGGRIRVDSEVGQGTCFQLTLPLDSGDEARMTDAG